MLSSLLMSFVMFVSSIVSGEAGCMGQDAQRFVATQLRHDIEAGRCVECAWYGWAAPTTTSVDAVEYVFELDGYHYPDCKYVLSAQDVAYYKRLGILTQDQRPDYLFYRSETLQIQAFFCEWPEGAEYVPLPVSRSDIM